MQLRALRCPHCQAAGRSAPRFGDVAEDFAERFEVVPGQAPGPCLLQVKCGKCNGYSTIRERPAEVSRWR